MAKRRYAWRIVAHYLDDTPALLLIGPAEEVAHVLRFIPKDLASMEAAARQAAELTDLYRAEGHTVNEKAFTLKGLMYPPA